MYTVLAMHLVNRLSKILVMAVTVWLGTIPILYHATIIIVQLRGKMDVLKNGFEVSQN